MERYKAYKDSGIDWIGHIPADWICANLGAIAKQRKNLNKDGQVNTVLSLSYGNIRRRIMDNTGLLPESFNTYNVIEDGDVVLRLTDLQNDQRSLRVGLCHEQGIITAAYTTLEPQSIESRYLFYSLAVFDYWKGFYGLAGGVRQSLMFDGIRSLRFPLPSRTEQQAIADYLDAKTVEIDALVADCEREVELLQEYRKAVISEAVTKGLNPDALMKDSGVEWIGKIPESWHAAPLKHMVASIESGTSLDGANWPASDDEKGVLTLSSVYQSRFDASCNKAVSPELYERLSCPLKNGTLLISRCNTSEWVGTAAYVHDAPDNLFLPDKLWQLSFTSDFNCRYIQYALQANVARNYFAALSVGASSTMQNIAKPDLLAAPIAIPDENEITVVVDYLDTKTTETDALIQAKQSMIDKLREYRRSLISEAVTGKFKVPGI